MRLVNPQQKCSKICPRTPRGWFGFWHSFVVVKIFHAMVVIQLSPTTPVPVEYVLDALPVLSCQELWEQLADDK